MEECKWSVKILSIYFQAPKSGGFQIVYKDRESQYKTFKTFKTFKIIK